MGNLCLGFKIGSSNSARNKLRSREHHKIPGFPVSTDGVSQDEENLFCRNPRRNSHQLNPHRQAA